MTPEKQRIAIAEACGWTQRADEESNFARDWIRRGADGEVNDWRVLPPDYLNDLNAMHEAEKKLVPGQYTLYYSNLGHAVRRNERQHSWPEVHATATQRAEAFLRTIGKWEDDE